MPKDWMVRDRDEELGDVQALARAIGVSPVTARLLAQRGLAEVDAAKGFLDPSLSELCDPNLLPNMEAGAGRLLQAVEAKEPILLFGDYDVDGSTGAAVLERILAALGGVVQVHIPNRNEGYGLGLPRMEQAVADGVKVVVSIDNGIAALEEARYLAEQGVDLVVADHHTMGEELPPACALIHPRLPGSDYPNPDLCGAGVAFKLAWGVAARAGANGRPTQKLRDLLLECLGLVALGTVADVVSLTGENRVLVRYGLKALGVGRTPGPRELLRTSRVEGRAPDASDVAFRLAPRLNAAGRMGDARRAYQLLVTQDDAEARALARELDEENTRRRALQDRVYKAAHAQVVEVYGEEPSAAGIVVWDEGWPHGIVGIVAAKLTEAFSRPALVASIEGEHAKGSGRSVSGVDLLASLEPHREVFVRMGGHLAAVGFTVESTRLPELREAFDAGVRAHLGIGPEAELREVQARLDGYEVVADVEVTLDEVSRQLLDELDRLSPFGQGNPEPLFSAKGVRLAGTPRLMGSTGKHVSFHLRQGDQVLRTVAFGRPDLWDLLQERLGPRPGEGPTCEVAFRPRLNRWNGQTKVELELKAIRFEDEPG
jgi:single-stranded-DNA-specific exonuclease